MKVKKNKLLINSSCLRSCFSYNWSFHKVMAHFSNEQYFFVFLNGTHRCWSLPFSPEFKLGIVIQKPAWEVEGKILIPLKTSSLPPQYVQLPTFQLIAGILLCQHHIRSG